MGEAKRRRVLGDVARPLQSRDPRFWWGVDPDIGVFAEPEDMVASLPKWRECYDERLVRWQRRTGEMFAPTAVAEIIALTHLRMTDSKNREFDAYSAAGGIPLDGREKLFEAIAALTVRCLPSDSQDFVTAVFAIRHVGALVVPEPWLKDWVMRASLPGGWLADSGLPIRLPARMVPPPGAEIMVSAGGGGTDAD